ncbi:MAG: hypothetical protein ACXVZX_12605 [Terriglobales bacterium]
MSMVTRPFAALAFTPELPITIVVATRDFVALMLPVLCSDAIPVVIAMPNIPVMVVLPVSLVVVLCRNVHRKAHDPDAYNCSVQKSLFHQRLRPINGHVCCRELAQRIQLLTSALWKRAGNFYR